MGSSACPAILRRGSGRRGSGRRGSGHRGSGRRGSGAASCASIGLHRGRALRVIGAHGRAVRPGGAGVEQRQSAWPDPARRAQPPWQSCQRPPFLGRLTMPLTTHRSSTRRAGSSAAAGGARQTKLRCDPLGVRESGGRNIWGRRTGGRAWRSRRDSNPRPPD
jgi:hypothetical protein